MSIGHRLAYRAWQFWKLIISKSLSEAERLEIANILSDDQMEIFTRQNSAAQQHAYRVYQRLVTAGSDDQDLLVAALLHDVGKIRYKSYWWDRPLVVFLGSVFPERIKEWGKGEHKGWQRPFVVKQQHAKWGADFARRAGCTPITVDLILYHQDEDATGQKVFESDLLDRLVQADNKS